MDVQFIASTAVITPDPSVSRRLYVDGLGLPLTASEGDDYLHSEDIGGTKHFGVWPLTQAAQACSAPEIGQLIDRCPRRASNSRSWTLARSRWPRTS